MIVYRVEGRNTGKGPYKLGAVRSQALEYCQGKDPHPAPCYDGIPKVEDRDFFGCADLQAIKNWFGHPECVDQLRLYSRAAREGSFLGNEPLVVRVYDAPDDAVKVGRKQVAFVRDRSLRQPGAIPIEEVVEL